MLFDVAVHANQRIRISPTATSCRPIFRSVHHIFMHYTRNISKFS